MNSLLSNLGPRYSRRNSTTPIILGFLLLIIAIAVATYFITTRNDDDDGKDKKDEGETVPSIEEPTVKRTLNPDPSNSSESGTTETYEIGGGKTETYIIGGGETETYKQTPTMSAEEVAKLSGSKVTAGAGVSDSSITSEALSKNVTIGITWTNRAGFDTTYRLEIRHYQRELGWSVEDNNVENNGVMNGYKLVSKVEKFRYKSGLAPGHSGSDGGNEEGDDASYFRNFASGLNHKFSGDGTTNFIGDNVITIIAQYYKANPSQTYPEITLFDGRHSDNIIQRARVEQSDLTATLSITTAKTIDYGPIQGSFIRDDIIIEKTAYLVKPHPYTDGVDINTIALKGGEVSPVLLVPHGGTASDQFRFKFENDGKILKWDGGNNKFIKVDSDGTNESLIHFKATPDESRETRDDLKYYRLMINDKYIVIIEGEATLKGMEEIDNQDVYNTLDWQFKKPSS